MEIFYINTDLFQLMNKKTTSKLFSLHIDLFNLLNTNAFISNGTENNERINIVYKKKFSLYPGKPLLKKS